MWNGGDSLPNLELACQTLEAFSPDRGKGSLVEPKPLPKIAHDLAIIIAAYNMEDYIQECLDSILSQKTCFDIVVRVVNDASTDRTAHFLERYTEDPRVEIITHKKNKVLSGARNTALQNLDARYVACVDADDLLYPDSIEKALSLADDTDADVIEVGLTRFSETNPNIYTLSPTESSDTQIDNICGQPTVFLYKTSLI